MPRVRVKRVTFRSLMPQQDEYLEESEKEINPFCAMQMRLGKTLANIRKVVQWCNDIDPYGDYPILVMGPSAVIASWEYELSLEYEQCIVIQGKTHYRRIQITVENAFAEGVGRVWILANYESITWTPGLVSLPWFTVIADESTAMKNPKSKISKLCAGGFNDAEHRVALSGFPAPEGLLDLFQQFLFLNKSFLGFDNYYKFRQKCFFMSYSGWKCRPGWKKIIQDEFHRKAFVKTSLDAGLGSKILREIRTVPMCAEQRKAYRQAEIEFLSIIRDKDLELEKTLETDHVIVQRTWMSRIAGGCNTLGVPQPKWNAKTREVISLLKGELKDQPVVMWFRFDAEILANYEALRKAGIQCQTITSRDSREIRKNKVSWFWNSKTKTRVLLCQELRVMSHGQDLSISSISIYYSYIHSAENIAQTEHRIVHPSKKEPVLSICLVSEGTIDEDTAIAIRDKIRNGKLFIQRMSQNFIKRTASYGIK